MHPQAHMLRPLFIALHDEDEDTALTTMKIIARISHLNPACVQPGQL